MVVASACAHHAPRGDDMSVPPGTLGASLTVVNHAFFDYERVGIVSAASGTDFRLRPDQLGHAGQIALQAHAIGTTSSYNSPAFNIGGGQQIEWTLEGDVTRSTVAVY